MGFPYVCGQGSYSILIWTPYGKSSVQLPYLLGGQLLSPSKFPLPLIPAFHTDNALLSFHINLFFEVLLWSWWQAWNKFEKRNSCSKKKEKKKKNWSRQKRVQLILIYQQFGVEENIKAYRGFISEELAYYTMIGNNAMISKTLFMKFDNL